MLPFVQCKWRPPGLKIKVSDRLETESKLLDSQTHNPLQFFFYYYFLPSLPFACYTGSRLSFGVCDDEMFVDFQTYTISDGYSRSGWGKKLTGI